MNPDEKAIRGIIGRCQDAWNSGDGAAFGAQFAEDADYVVVNGQSVRGGRAQPTSAYLRSSLAHRRRALLCILLATLSPMPLRAANRSKRA